MTAGIENFQVATPDAYAGAAPGWKRRMLAAQLLQQQAQTGDKVYGAGLGGMKLLASALGGWMEGKEEAKDRERAADIMKYSPANDLPAEPATAPATSIVPSAPRPAVSSSSGKAVTNYDPKN